MKQYKLYFTDSIEGLENEVLIHESFSIHAIIQHAEAALQDAGYNPTPYWRYLFTNSGAFIDFGSWSKFLFIANATYDEVFPR
jgi:hypothetical protein